MGLGYNTDTGNYFVGVNYGRNPVVNFNFILRVEAVFDLPCKSIRVFQKENEFEYIQEGGLNDYVHMRRKPISKPFTFQVERYVGVDSLDPLKTGTEIILPVILIVNRYIRGSYLPVRLYVFTGVTVMGKEYGELAAEKSGLLTEVTTLAYRDMYCIDNPITGLTGDKWKFKKQGEGEKKPDYKGENWKDTNAKHNSDEKRQSDMESAAKLWKFHDSGKLEATKKGVGTQSAKHIQAANDSGVMEDSEPLKAAMEAKAQKWQFHASNKLEATKKGVGTQSAVHLQTTASDGTTKIDVEPLKTTMEGLAKKWTFSEQTKEGAGDRSAANASPAFEISEDAKAIWEATAAKKKWEFDEKTKAGNTRRQAQTGGIVEESASALAGKAQKWEFKNQIKEGNMNQSAAKAGKEATKTAIARKASKWRFKDEEKAGNGKQSAKSLSTIGLNEELTKTEMEVNAKKWEFSEQEKAGSGVQSAQTIPSIVEETKSELEAKAKEHEWKFSGLTKAGQGTQSSVRIEEEETKAQLEAGAMLWNFEDTTKAGSGTQSAQTDPNEEEKGALADKAKLWKMGPEKGGSGTQSALIDPSEEAQSALAGKAKLWKMGKDKAGKGTQSANHGKIKELSKSAMEGKAHKYPKKKSAQDVAKFLSKSKKK